MKQLAHNCFFAAAVIAAMAYLDIPPSVAVVAFWLVLGIVTGVIALAIAAASARP